MALEVVEARQKLAPPELEKRPRYTSVKASWLRNGELRLDASFYTEDVRLAVRLLNESGYPLHYEEAFNPPPLRRHFSDEHGTPYLMPSELFLFKLTPTKFVYADKIKNVEDWYVKEGWIIVTQSGLAGVPLLVTKPLEKFVVSQNAIRIVPSVTELSGFLYAYLSTWIGHSLLTKDQFGVTVEHIEPHHVKSVPIPFLPEDIQKQIHENIIKAYKLRDNARDLLNEAEKLLFQELSISEQIEIPTIKNFTVKSSELKSRFDASYHTPIVEFLRSKLSEGKYSVEKLGKIAKVYIPPRFRRIYVEKDYGIPFLQGAHIPQIKPYDLKYISKKATKNIEDWIIHDGWVLVTCSGTIGRVALATHIWDGWAASQHILRIIPHDPKELHPGFLTTFLSTPYGYHQVVAKTYGGVVDEISESDVRGVVIPKPPSDVQEQIGKLVVEAYELKEEANRIENDTIRTLEDMLSKHRKGIGTPSYEDEVEAYRDTFEVLGDSEAMRTIKESISEVKAGKTMKWDEFLSELRKHRDLST